MKGAFSVPFVLLRQLNTRYCKHKICVPAAQDTPPRQPALGGDGQADRAINVSPGPDLGTSGAMTAQRIMKLAHARPRTCDGTLRHTLRTVLRSYDSPARGGLQYPPSPGVRGKYGESVSKRNDFSRAGGIARSMYADTTFPARLFFEDGRL